ncbi:MarR family winged helix-turn-helix transcriptional regulator [Arthrobacter sp. CAN_A1]|uniref:MarR family winged helix-turn-helix transcriptional regulator n=1 Tax=Arthrobacter sp. CAN_A1 TaxID=2787717 RepID=UPI0018CA3D41
MLDLDLDQWSTSRLLLTATRLVENAWSKELADFGITHAGLTVLVVITLQGAGTQSEIARSVRVQPQTMIRILDNLEYKGFVARVQTSVNQKKQLFAITPAGSKVLHSTAEMEQNILPRDQLPDGSVRRYLQQAIAELTRPRTRGM